MAGANHPIPFWVIIVFLIVSILLLLRGQTMAIFNYQIAVKLGLQEDVKEVSEFGVQINRPKIINLPLLSYQCHPNIQNIGIMLDP
jgi:hypothetical protein